MLWFSFTLRELRLRGSMWGTHTWQNPDGAAVGLVGTALGVWGRKQPGHRHRGVCGQTSIAGLGI